MIAFKLKIYLERIHKNLHFIIVCVQDCSLKKNIKLKKQFLLKQGLN